MFQITDATEIEKIIEKVILDNPKQLEQYRGGKTKLQGFFAGQVFPSPPYSLFVLLVYEN